MLVSFYYAINWVLPTNEFKEVGHQQYQISWDHFDRGRLIQFVTHSCCLTTITSIQNKFQVYASVEVSFDYC